MSQSGPNLVPIYVEARSDAGRPVCAVLPAFADDSTTGPYHCHAIAPNGLEAHGTLHQLRYDDVAGLFNASSPLGLFLDPPPRPGAAAPVLPEIRLTLWSGGNAVETGKAAVQIVDDYGLPALALPDPDGAIDHIQLWGARGGMVVTAWPKNGRMIPMPGRPDAARRIRPVIIDTDLRSSAYWAFLRHSKMGAVRCLGREILERVCDPDAEPDLPELVVAAHFLLNSAVGAEASHEMVARRLQTAPAGDGAVLYWTLAFDGLVACTDREKRDAFAEAVRAARDCHYTASIRLLLERLGGGEADFREQRPGDSLELEEGLRWIALLAQATYWDSEFLSYRAIDPAHPDANATDDLLAIGAKKKSG